MCSDRRPYLGIWVGVDVKLTLGKHWQGQKPHAFDFLGQCVWVGGWSVGGEWVVEWVGGVWWMGGWVGGWVGVEGGIPNFPF